MIVENKTNGYLSKSNSFQENKLRETVYQKQKKKIQEKYNEFNLYSNIPNTLNYNKDKKFIFDSNSKDIDDQYSCSLFSSTLQNHEEIPYTSENWLCPNVIPDSFGIDIKGIALKSNLCLESIK